MLLSSSGAYLSPDRWVPARGWPQGNLPEGSGRPEDRELWGEGRHPHSALPYSLPALGLSGVLRPNPVSNAGRLLLFAHAQVQIGCLAFSTLTVADESLCQRVQSLCPRRPMRTGGLGAKAGRWGRWPVSGVGTFSLARGPWREREAFFVARDSEGIGRPQAPRPILPPAVLCDFGQDPAPLWASASNAKSGSWR